MKALDHIYSKVSFSSVMKVQETEGRGNKEIK